MSNQINLGTEVLDTITGGTISFIINKIRTTATFQKIDHRLNPDDLSKEIKQLLDKAINMARDGLPEIEKKVLKENLENNMEVIYSWIISPEDLKLTEQLEHIELLYPEERKTLERFFKKLFHQIQSNRDDYNLILSLQIKHNINSLRKNQESMISNQRLIITNQEFMENQLNRLLADKSSTKTASSFSKTLIQIEQYIESRNSKDAIRIALSVKGEILSNENTEEIEKLYQLFVNAYLQESKNQKLAIEPLLQLINCTTLPEKKIQREILLLIIRKDYDNADKMINSTDYTKFKDKLIIDNIHNLKLNLFILRKEYSEAILFLNSIKDDYDDYLYWLCQIYIVLDNQKAYNLFQENPIFFSKDNFVIKKLSFEVLFTHTIDEINRGKNLESNFNTLKTLLLDIDNIIAQSGDDNVVKSTLHCQKAYILVELNEAEKAETEFLKAEQLEPENSLLLRNYPILLSSSNNVKKIDKALSLLLKYIEKNACDYIALNLYFNILVKNKTKNAIDKLEKILNKNNIPLYIKIQLIEAYDLNFNKSKAETTILHLEKRYPDDPLILFCKAKHNQKHNIDTAILLYESAIQNGIMEPYLMFSIINIVNLFLNKNTLYFIEKGIDIIKSNYNENFILNNLGAIYIECLFRAKKIIECLKMCNKIDLIKHNDIHMIKIRCYCYYETQNYILAIESFKLLKELGGFKNNDLYILTKCYISIGQTEIAKEIMPYIDGPVNEEDFLYISQFYFLIGENNSAVNIINEGFIKFPYSRSIMEMYINLVFKYRITPLDKLQKNTFKKCIDTYTNSSFENKIISRFNVSENITPEQLVEELDRFVGKDRSQDLFKAHKYFDDIQSKHLPLSFIKGINNKNFLYIWFESISNKNVQFWSAYGNEEDDIEKSRLFFNEVYIDLSSLLILQNLKLLHYLTTTFKYIYITQSIFDELQNVLLDKKNITMASNYLDFTNKEKISYTQYSSNFYNKAWEAATEIIELIKNRPDIFKIVGKPISFINNESKILNDYASNELILFDTECVRNSYIQNIPLIYDNLSIRQIFNNLENNPGALSVIAFIQKLHEMGNFTSQYYAIISKLICYNFNSFKINKDLFIYNMIYEGYSINPKIEMIFKLLGDSKYSQHSILDISIELFVYIWLRVLPMEVKEKWTYYLEEIISFRGDITHKEIISYLYNISLHIANIQSREYLEKVILKLIEKYHNEI